MAPGAPAPDTGPVVATDPAQPPAPPLPAAQTALLADPVVDRLITGGDAFEDLPAVQARLALDPGDTLMHRIRYP